MNSRIRNLFYIFLLNPDYVAARSLRSLRSKNIKPIKKHGHVTYFLLTTKYSLTTFLQLAIEVACRTHKGTEVHISTIRLK